MGIKVKIKKLWERIYGDNTKQVLYATIPFILFGLESIQLFLTGKADWFSRLGSLIVAWALINLAVRRQKYSQYIWNVERGRIYARLNYEAEMRDLAYDSLTVTFDVHAAQIAQINQELGHENPFVENNPDSIKKFCHDVQKRLDDAPWVEKSKQLISDESDVDEKYRKTIRLYTGWGKLLWRLEVVLIIWGTLQWGYGDLLVEWWVSYKGL